MTRSRLRRPTSKSTTATFCPDCASAAPSAAVDVVLPTPPLPDVTTTTLDMSPSSAVLFQSFNQHGLSFEPGLHGPAAELDFQLIRRTIKAGDREKLGFDPA